MAAAVAPCGAGPQPALPSPGHACSPPGRPRPAAAVPGRSLHAGGDTQQAAGAGRRQVPAGRCAASRGSSGEQPGEGQDQGQQGQLEQQEKQEQEEQQYGGEEEEEEGEMNPADRFLSQQLRASGSMRDVQRALAAAPHPPCSRAVFVVLVRTCRLLRRAQGEEDKALLQQVRSASRWGGPGTPPPLNLPAPMPGTAQGGSQQQQQQRGRRRKPGSAAAGAWAGELALARKVLAGLAPQLQAMCTEGRPSAPELAHVALALGLAFPALTADGTTQLGEPGAAGGGPAPAQVLQVQGTLLQAALAAQPQLATCPSDCLAKLLWGLGALGLRPGRAWLQAAEAACQGHSCRMGAWSSVQLLQGLALLRHPPRPALILDLTTRLQPQLDWLSPRYLTDLLSSLASLGFLPPAAWLGQFFLHSSSKLPGLTPALAERAVLALARLRLAPPEPWGQRLLRCCHRALGAYTPQQLLNCLHGLVRLGVPLPRAWLHDAFSTLRGLPLPVGAGQPRGLRHAPVQLQRLAAAAAAAAAASGTSSGRGTATARGGASAPPGARQLQEQALGASSSSSSSSGAPGSSTGGSAGPAPSRAKQHQGGKGEEGTAARWPQHAPLGQEQLAQLMWVGAKLHRDPAVTRHVPWLRAQLPAYLQQQLQGRQRPGAAGGPAAAGGAAAGTAAGAQAAAGSRPPPLLSLLPASRVEQLLEVLYVCAELAGPSYFQAAHDSVTSLLAELGQPACMGQLAAGQCASCMVCLALLKAVPEPAWCAAFFSRVLRVLPSMRPIELATLLTGAASLGLHPGEELLAGARGYASGLALTDLAGLVRKLDGSQVAGRVGWLAEFRQAARAAFAGKA